MAVVVFLLLFVLYTRSNGEIDQNGQGNIFKFSPLSAPTSTQIMGGEI